LFLDALAGFAESFPAATPRTAWATRQGGRRSGTPRPIPGRLPQDHEGCRTSADEAARPAPWLGDEGTRSRGPTKVVQEILGHRLAMVTLDTYSTSSRA
jgi:hypothetical protein